VAIVSAATILTPLYVGIIQEYLQSEYSKYSSFMINLLKSDDERLGPSDIHTRAFSRQAIAPARRYGLSP
jgi:hypothetical protein